ncbi:MAG: hypothetical protein V3V51_08890 [Desulfobacterales bacterium]|jgi:hypothetical protein
MRFNLLIYAIVALSLAEIPGVASELSSGKPIEKELLDGKAFITKLKPPHQTGKGYKLVYVVEAPIEAFWKFKTDFDNDFLLSNKFIKSHRLLSRRGNVVVTEDIFTEDVYTHRPSAKFRWQTTVSPDRYRLDFVLRNPEQCGQKFHYGHIQLETLETIGQKTKVTQVAYFDFFGAFFWVNYPWYGGMMDFLKYTARWEQETILKLKSKYGKSVQ